MIINKRIDWKQGMEITPYTFIEADYYEQFNHDINRKLASIKSYGLLPKVKFNINSDIINSSIEIHEINCEAITRNGLFFQIFEKFTFELPSLLKGEYYIVAKIKEYIQLEVNEVPYIQMEYDFELKELAELSDGNLFPLIKIRKENEYWEKVDYIPPSFALSCSRMLSNKHEEIKKLLNEISECIYNKKYESYLTYSFSMLLLEMNHYTKNETPYELVLLLKKFVKTFLFFEQNIGEKAINFIKKEFDNNDIFITLEEVTIIFYYFKEILGKEEIFEELPEKEEPIIEDNEWNPVI
ncbi:MAG: hypothetical protein ACOYO1_00710 [Bacteroidales bacterium]